MRAGNFIGVFSRNGTVSMPAVHAALCNGDVSVFGSVNNEVAFFQNDRKGNIVKDDDGWVICGKAEIYNREDVCKKLAIGNQPANDLELILQAFKKTGSSTPGLLNGAFSFAIWDPQTEALFAARDHIGLFPLFYFISERLFFFSDSIKLLSKFAFARCLNNSKIIQLLQKTYGDKEQTIFEEIQSLSPAYSICVDRKKSVCRKYWALSAVLPSRVQNLEDAAEGLQDRLLIAMRTRLDGDLNVGIELSGGLDSSSIAVLASQIADRKELFAFSNVLPVAHKQSFAGFSDEWDKATMVADHLGLPAPTAIDHIEDPVTLSESIIEQAGIPFNFYLSFYQTGIYKAAACQGVGALFSGFGGDEGISMQVGQRYVVSMVRQLQLQSLFCHYSKMGLFRGKAVVATAYQVGRYALRNKHRENRRYLLNRYNHLLFTNDLLEDDLNRKQYLGDDYFKHYSPGERMNFFMTSGGTTARLESGYFISGAYGLSYKYPFLDVSVLEYFYSLPDALKVNADGDRAVLRKAMEGLLPASIINQPKQPAIASATVPFHRVERERHFERVKDYLMSLSESHQLFDFWDRNKLSSLRLGVHNSYIEGKYYDQLLAGMMLSLFLQQQKATTFHEI
ncbi:asparagine synthetase B family protein [Polluticoccus soli]|uniref:asparagine synthetase B family protein n=1 Tax=Polluticoccus soli TaxID=3034150 RepID=UPI0023E2F93D|nr:asparagine synthase-related protein [Flavipsychrobacter sp. JY13-12]